MSVTHVLPDNKKTRRLTGRREEGEEEERRRGEEIGEADPFCREVAWTSRGATGGRPSNPSTQAGPETHD